MAQVGGPFLFSTVARPRGRLAVELQREQGLDLNT